MSTRKKLLVNCIETLETILETELFTHLIGEEPTLLKKEIQEGNTLKDCFLPERLLYIHQTVYYLSGSYTEEGIRRWFQRERYQLDMKTPLHYLGNNWYPQDIKAKVVLALARSSTDHGAT